MAPAKRNADFMKPVLAVPSPGLKDKPFHGNDLLANRYDTEPSVVELQQYSKTRGILFCGCIT